MIRKLPDTSFYINSLAPTPLVPVRLGESDPEIYCKLEFLNPSGSTKDRIARYILEKAWREGCLQAGDRVVEASSGSTSIAMALASAQMGVRFVAVMPEGVSAERGLMIRGLGGEVRLTRKDEGIHGALAEVERLGKEPRTFLPRQFTNPDNATAHRIGTAREILDQIPGGGVDAVVSGVGTGGTLVGLYQGCADAGCAVTPVYARPVDLGETPEVECCSYSAKIPGVVECVSTIYREDALPGLLTVEVRDRDAIAAARQLIARGFPVGPSSGLNFCAAVEVARRLGAEAHVVTVFPDRMERYFTTELFRPFQP
jgi:cysteine synthase A